MCVSQVKPIADCMTFAMICLSKTLEPFPLVEHSSPVNLL